MKQERWILALMLGATFHWNTHGAHLLNVNFTTQTGQAAIGQTGSDVWNVYSRDDGSGGFLRGNGRSHRVRRSPYVVERSAVLPSGVGGGGRNRDR